MLGQDLEAGPDGRIRIARRVAPDRVISTVDPEARHGHKTDHRGFDGYKGHVALDPDAELVTATAVTPGNAGDASVALELLATELAVPAERDVDPPVVYGDAAYGTGPLLATLEAAGVVSRVKVQPPSAPARPLHQGRLRDRPRGRHGHLPGGAGRPAPRDGAGNGRPASAAPAPPARSRPAARPRPRGRTITVGPHEALLAAGRAASRDPAWRADYRATRPKVERKLAHLVRRRHGGRRARVRGRLKVGADFSLLAAAVNLARLAVLGLSGSGGTWAVRPT